MKRRGSVTIEAAISLPIFMLVIYVFIYFSTLVYIYERVQYGITEVANEIACTAYIMDKTGLVDIQQKTYKDAKKNLNEFEKQWTSVIENAVNVKQQFDGLVEYTGIKDQSIFETAKEKMSTEGIIQYILEVRNRIKSTIESCEALVNQITSFVKYVAEDSSKILLSMGAYAGLEAVNEAIGVRIASHLMENYISDETLTALGVYGGASGLDYSGSSFMLENDDIIIKVKYKVEFPFFTPLRMPVEQSVTIRAFTGNGNFENAHKALKDDKKKDEDEKEEEQEEVVYITEYGQRYHLYRHCDYIDVKVKSKIYGELKGKEVICEICKKECKTLNILTIVYKTDKSNIYHVSLQCFEVTRYVKEITLEEAESSGYTLCFRCKKAKGE